MIDEKKLIEELREKGKEYDKDCEYWLQKEKHKTRLTRLICAGKCTGIVQAMKIVENQPKVGDWIPCSERLPENDNYILLSFENFSLPLVGRYEKDENGGAFYVGDCDEDDTCLANDLFVNAWMQLPEPYKEE